ncbi:hypothetical protein M6B38_360750 [Iris pallida]|uniref:Uncharacterized protein n=1 Tax=Iris pallida TaxID=29817 RepID=A0AAX6GK73_IRIPA|nr:hypothetical protein M6B38_360750 [Iris pallida]
MERMCSIWWNMFLSLLKLLFRYFLSISML